MTRHLHFSAIVALLLQSGAATPTRATKQCVQLETALQITANNSRFQTLRVDSNIDVVDWVWDTDTWSHPNTTARITGVLPVHDTFAISAQLCVPNGGSKAHILQIATHGSGFDKRYATGSSQDQSNNANSFACRYWDIEVKADEYSYVDAAIAQGYSILTYDRLGTGGSAKPDAYDVVQAPAEVEILRELTKLAREGNLTTSIKETAELPSCIRGYKPTKVVHVSHSFGSVITAGLLSKYGNLSDGALLTGYLLSSQLGNVKNEAFGYEFAATSDPRRFSDRPSGYLVQATASNVQQIFFKKGSFEPELLVYAEKIKQTTTVVEPMSAATVAGIPALQFKGPVQVRANAARLHAQLLLLTGCFIFVVLHWRV
jgi:pimeloyl-ACP methyl ester carboxylesterase